MNAEIHLTDVDKIITTVGGEAKDVIAILQKLQEHFGYLPELALRHVCETTDIHPAAITGVSTFYSQFRHQPVGQHIINVCMGTACHVKGSGLVMDAFRRQLALKNGEDTDQEGLFTLQNVACLGCCTLAPVVQIDNVTYGHVRPDAVPKILTDFLTRQSNGQPTARSAQSTATADFQGEIRIGLGSCCVASGSGAVQQALEQVLTENNISARVKRVGCVGMCHQTPLVEIIPPNESATLYAHVQPHEVNQIVLNHFQPANFFQRLNNRTLSWLEKFVTDENADSIDHYPIDHRDPPVAAFLHRQRHIATEHCGIIDPTDLDEYQQRGGFQALRQVLAELTPEQVIETIQKSGLRGRGGAGFSTGKKWAIVRAAAGALKYLICNGDEGDPGAFMDRMLLESYPFRIIEGMIIAAYAVAAQEGYLYIRAEYPLAVQRIREALEKCEAAGLLGENILKSGFSLHLRIMEGAGAFVCGEETALIESIEGKRGMPHLRPPYPAQQGLWDQPTLVNNTETFAVVPWILRNGAEAFAAMGTTKSKGTKVFALAGKINRGGLIEVPMGITIREIVEDIGGGIAGGKRFKAVQIGGPSGGCVPARLAHTPVDYEALLEVGAMMGSGGLLVLDDSDCMVDIAHYFLSFTQNQSCGKCTFCRVGTRRMLDILERLCEGKAQPNDLNQLEDLALKTKQASLCGLGKTAPNPVLTTLKYFHEEFEAHFAGHCPAGKCKALITYTITDRCIGCTRCAQHCPVEAILPTPYHQHVIDHEKCTRCDICRQVCPENAIEVH